MANSAIQQFQPLSNFCAVREAANPLVWFYSKIDPSVVLRNKYDSEDGDFVGVRFKIVRNGKIFTYHQRKVIDEVVVYEKSNGSVTYKMDDNPFNPLVIKLQ